MRCFWIDKIGYRTHHIGSLVIHIPPFNLSLFSRHSSPPKRNVECKMLSIILILLYKLQKKTLPTTGLINLRVSFVSMDSHPLGDDVMISNFAVVYHPSSSLSFSSNNIVCCNCLFLNYSAKKKISWAHQEKDREVIYLKKQKTHRHCSLSIFFFLHSYVY